MLEQQLINALSLGSVYALFALGFTLIFGILGVINLSHGAIFMLGSYTALLLVDTASYQDLRTRLEPLTAADRPFRHSARELLAFGAWRAGETGGVSTGRTRRPRALRSGAPCGCSRRCCSPPGRWWPAPLAGVPSHTLTP